MSYTIIYDRQVIKTPEGFTLSLLQGDNNVWDDNRRRSRNWYSPLVNVPEEKIYSFFSGVSGELFKWNGRYVDGTNILRWVKNTMNNAMTIEDIVDSSRRELLCYLESYDGHNYTSEDWAFIRSTDRYLEWLRSTEGKIKNPEPGIRYTRHIGFEGDKPLGITHRTSNANGRTIVKCKDAYVKEYQYRADATRGISMTRDIRQAKIFATREEAVEACSPFRHISYVDADAALKRDAAKNYVLCFTSYSPVKYAQKRGRNRWYIVSSIRDAKRYTKKEAEAHAKKANAVGHVVSVVSLEDN